MLNVVSLFQGMVRSTLSWLGCPSAKTKPVPRFCSVNPQPLGIAFGWSELNGNESPSELTAGTESSVVALDVTARISPLVDH